MQRVGVIFVGLGQYFDAFFVEYRAAVQRWLLPGWAKTIYVVTDPEHAQHAALQADDVDVHVVDDPAMQPWPMPTLRRFAFIRRPAGRLRATSHVIFLDADCLVIRPVTLDELLPAGKRLFGLRHPWYLQKTGTFETDRRSRACVDPARDDLSTYWQGCLWGGVTPAVLALSRELERRIEEDLAEGTVALWHDESHLNRYFIDHKPDVYSVGPEYAVPEQLHLDPRRCAAMGIAPAKIVHREGQLQLRLTAGRQERDPS